jgi:hypothetical protein
MISHLHVIRDPNHTNCDSALCRVGIGQRIVTQLISQTHLPRATCISYLHSDGCLLRHSLIHADEGYIVVQVIDRALQREEGRGTWIWTCLPCLLALLPTSGW